MTFLELLIAIAMMAVSVAALGAALALHADRNAGSLCSCKVILGLFACVLIAALVAVQLATMGAG